MLFVLKRQREDAFVVVRVMSPEIAATILVLPLVVRPDGIEPANATFSPAIRDEGGKALRIRFAKSK